MDSLLTTLKGLSADIAAWSPIAESFLSRIDSDCPVEFYREQVKSKRASLLHVKTPEGETVAAVVVRIDKEPTGDELVIVAAGGHCPGRFMTLDFLPALEGLAKKIGCKSMRAHTRRTAVKAGFERAGFTMQEFVMAKAV